MHRRWLPDAPNGVPRVLALPFAGCGPSIYRKLQTKLRTELDVELHPVRPPGIESRFGEGRCESHEAYAQSLAAEIVAEIDAPYSLFGHCGAIPYLLETIRALSSDKAGAFLPTNVIVSGWGPPQRGLYGRLNHTDLEDISFEDEIERMARVTGARLSDEFAEIYAEQIAFEIRQQRSYRFRPLPEIAVDVDVIGWQGDEVVPYDVCIDTAWSEVFPAGSVNYTTMTGSHFSFIDAPADLCRLIATRLQR